MTINLVHSPSYRLGLVQVLCMFRRCKILEGGPLCALTEKAARWAQVKVDQRAAEMAHVKASLMGTGTGIDLVLPNNEMQTGFMSVTTTSWYHALSSSISQASVSLSKKMEIHTS